MNLIVAARSAIQGWRQRERAYDELMSLDDRSLADIGIHRSEIPAVVEGFHDLSGRDAVAPVAAEPRLSPAQSRLANGVRWLPPI
ncbi:MAG: DUF1127 domain-containing protein [Alphaproteobacteria bacterium]|nr:DUF1127 domain-containing protein [Alphaproteobacteria bacterium]